MAEAIAALAFAGNIIQLLELGAKFALKADQIIKAGSSSLSDLQELRHITHYLQPLLQQLDTDDSSHQGSTKSSSQSRLIKLSKECSQVVEELLHTLDRAGVNDPGGRRDAIFTSFRLTWNHSKIEKLHQKIDKLRGQLAVELLISIRETSSQSLQTQEAILQQLKADSRYSPAEPREQGGPGLVDDLGDAPGSIMLQYIRSTLKSDLADEQMMKTEEDVHHLLFQQEDHVDDDNNVGRKRPRIEMEHSRREKIEARIISSLRYSQIADRETSIAEAYRETFQWMFKVRPLDRKDTKFREWLESSDRLYWITGKAGSGKSTLMKYISSFDGTSDGSLKCKEHLQKWADGEDRLVVASFYFWASGSSIQASQQGLFRSLLFQILNKHPDLLPQITPGTWEAWSSFGLMMNIEREKSLDQILLSAIKELVEQRNKKVCLFVDGLDEYQGDHGNLIARFRSFLLLPNVKICVSSRPWIVFEDSFKTAPSLLVQEFTYPDIEHFVTSRFNENEGFARLQMREPDYATQLMTSITDKASGVFLWIKLVVASLLTGLSNDDRISDLQRRLSLLPPDLEKLYDAILENLDPFYFGHASQYFQLMDASDDGPDVLLFSFSDEESSDFAINLPIRAFTQAEIKFRTDTVKRRLNSRCKGLLEVSPSNRVQFLHRSVKEYIDSSEVRQRINRAIKADFDCHFQLCSANLAMTKKTPDTVFKIYFAEDCLKMAALVKRNIVGMIQILDNLDQTIHETAPSEVLMQFYRKMPQENFSHTSGLHMGTSFLATTVRFSVVEYVRARAEAHCLAPDNNSNHEDSMRYPLDQDPENLSRFRRLLQKSKLLTLSGVVKTSVRPRGTWPLLIDANQCDPISLPMFRCLLELRADPNLVFYRYGTSPWIETLAAMLMITDDHSSYEDPALHEVWEQWVPILVLFMEYGAQMDDSVYEKAVRRANERGGRYFPRNWLATVMECVATGRKELGLKYLTGENDLATFKMRRKPRTFLRSRNL